jgi:AmmeMemoRadiSam system protein A
VPSLSPEHHWSRLARDDREHLVAIAREAVRIGLDRDEQWLPDRDHLPARLLDAAATFVTLRRGDELLGCIGTIEPRRPLADDVAVNATGAAFADPRLPSVTWDDLGEMTVKISVLGPLEPVPSRSLDELRAAVQVGVDGLLIADRDRRATFLPSVWEQVPDVDTFLTMLWQKAGLRDDSWPRHLSVHRYDTLEFGD